MQRQTPVFGSQAGRVIASAILLAGSFLGGQSAQAPTPKSPKQIALWVIQDVWNKGDLRLANQMFTPGALFHYRGRDFPLTPEFGLQTVQNWRTGFPDFHSRETPLLCEFHAPERIGENFGDWMRQAGKSM